MADSHLQIFTYLVRVATIVTLCVIVLGAFVRLSDAGLGCPDWPGCYGHWLGVPQTPLEIAQANEQYTTNSVHVEKAWKEMIHRYLAGLLGLIILGLTLIAVRNRQDSRQPVMLPLFTLGLTLFQAILGMWTVTLFLQPVIVTLHLLGGMTILSLLWWLVLKTSVKQKPDRSVPNYKIKLGIFVTVLLALQITLGGWTSANYAALACLDFPTCQQQWWPDAMDFKQAFTLWHNTGINYALNPMDSPARTAIHLLHRIGALIVLVTSGFFLATLCRRNIPTPLKSAAIAALGLLLIQVALGISNVLFYLPLPVATAHNGIAALLLLAMLRIIYMLKLPSIKYKVPL